MNPSKRTSSISKRAPYDIAPHSHIVRLFDDSLNRARYSDELPDFEAKWSEWIEVPVRKLIEEEGSWYNWREKGEPTKKKIDELIYTGKYIAYNLMKLAEEGALEGRLMEVAERVNDLQGALEEWAQQVQKSQRTSRILQTVTGILRS